MLIDGDKLRTDLKENVAEVVIIKQDGNPRVLKCTLMRRYLPEGYNPPEIKNQDLLTVWDVEQNGWRSFHPKQVISCQMINW